METQTRPVLNPVKLSIDSSFKFACHKKLKCFTQCCKDINIILTPYDIIRLKNRLELSTDEFLAIYTEPQVLEKTDLPVVTLKMLDDEEKPCPFVRETGCIIYEDRPTICSYYPLGTGTLAHKEEVKDQQGFYFFVNEPHCTGFEEEDLWTVRTWREDQGVDLYDEANAGWTELVVMKRSFPPNVKLSQKAKELFFMVSYNADKFRRFVSESSFFKLYNIDKETQEKILKDEVELIKFGFKWMKWSLFKEGDFEINKEASQERRSGS